MYSNFWHFIESYLPNYYTRDDVLLSDMLFRYVTNDSMSFEDMQYIKDNYSTYNDARKACMALDIKFAIEALNNYYKELLSLNYK